MRAPAPKRLRGTSRSGSPNSCRGPRTRSSGLREAVRERFLAALPGHPYAGVLIALAIGDQHAIDAGQWQLFARTGVSHLM